MANPRKFSEKIALHNQKQAEETAAFEKIMREVSDATNKVNSNTRRAKVKVLPKSEVENIEIQQALGTFRSGSLPNVAAPPLPTSQPEITKPEEAITAQYLGGRSGGTSPAPRSPVQRGRASSSVGPMRRPADRKHDTSPYGSSAYLSPPDSNWRRTNSDSALHQSCGEQQAPSQPLSPHHPLHSHAHPHAHPHQNHRRAGNIHLDVLATLGMNPTNRPRSSCEIPRIPNNNNVYESGGDGGGGGGGGGGAGGLSCDLQVPGGSLPDLTALHFPSPYMRASPPYQPRYQSPTSPGGVSPGGVSPGGGSVSPATGGLSPGSGSPVGATVPLGLHHDHTLYDTQNMSPLDHTWMTSSYQPHCSPPSQYSSTSNINIPSPTMVHSPGSPVESPQDYNNLHQALLQPFEQITMDWAQLVQGLVESGWTAHVQIADNLDQPTSNYNTNYINHSSPHSPQSTNSPHTYSQSHVSHASHVSHVAHEARISHSHAHAPSERPRDPVPAYTALRPLSPPHPPTPNTPASIPDIILTDYSGDLDAGIFGGEEAQLRAGLDLDELTLLEEPSSLLPDSAVEHEFRLDRLDGL